MALWHVMKKHKENDVYYQVLPYDTRVIYDLLRMRRGVRKSIKFMWNSRWIEKRAYRLADRKNEKKISVFDYKKADKRPIKSR